MAGIFILYIVVTNWYALTYKKPNHEIKVFLSGKKTLQDNNPV